MRAKLFSPPDVQLGVAISFTPLKLLKNSFERVFCTLFLSVVLFDGVLVALAIYHNEHFGFPPFLITKQGSVNASNLSLFNFRVKSVGTAEKVPQSRQTIHSAQYL